MFSWMKKQPWHRPNLRFYTGMMNFLGKHGQAELVTLLFQVRVDLATLIWLVRCFVCIRKAVLFLAPLEIGEFLGK